jgi:basic amino acid/polyamine antiporter, APA family
MSGRERELTLLDCFGLGLNGIIGSGIFLLPAVLYRRAGGAAPVAWLMVGGFCALVALCFAEAAGRTDRQGGPYRYAFDAFGPRAALLVGWISLVSTTLGYAAVARAFAEHVLPLGGLSDAVARPLVVVALISVLGAINVVGVRPGARTSSIVSLLKIGALIAFCAVGLSKLRTGALSAPPSPDPGEPRGLMAAAFAGLFATTGFEYVPVPAGEVRHPQRNVGIAAVGSVLAATVVYALVQISAQGATDAIAHARTPVVDAAAVLLGPSGRTAMLVAALVSAFGFCSSSAFVAPRYVESLAHDGFLPARLGQRSVRWGTPAVAVIAVSAIAAALACQLDFAHLADTSVVAIVTQYIGTAVAVLALRRKDGPSPGFRLPFGRVVPIAATLGSVAFLAAAGWKDLVAGLFLLAIGGTLGTLMRRARRV